MRNLYPQLIRILSAEATDKTRFKWGHCGTYALALHDLSGGKLKLGMIRGERTEDGDVSDVNVHSYVLHPTQPGKMLDVDGIADIKECAEEWESKQDSDSDPHYVEEEFNNREDFLKALKETGHPEIKEMYAKAVKMIKKTGILKGYI